MSGPTATERACSKSELEVFQPIDVQVALTEGRWHTYQPLNGLSRNSDVIEFVIPGTPHEGVDLNNISIYVAGRIKTAAGANITNVQARNAAGGVEAADAMTVAPVNNFLGSLFRHVDVSINGQLLTRASREYAYKDFLMKSLFFQMPHGGKEKTQGECFGYYPDEPPTRAGEYTRNTGAVIRAAWIEGSKRFELRGPVGLDLFSTDRLLFPGTDIHVKIHLNEAKFFLMDFGGTAAARNSYKLELEDVEMYVRRVTIGDSFVADMSKEIEHRDAIYPFTRREITSFSIATGLSSAIKENLFRGQLATRYFVCMVDAAAFNGTTIASNPYLFKHFNLNEIALMENGQTIAGPPLKVDFDNGKYLNAYYMLLESIGALGERALYPPITKEQFKNHMCIFCFTRSPDLCHGEVALPNQIGNLTLRLTFGAPMTAAVTCIVMAEFDSRIQINQHKNVITDYAV